MQDLLVKLIDVTTPDFLAFPQQKPATKWLNRATATTPTFLVTVDVLNCSHHLWAGQTPGSSSDDDQVVVKGFIFSIEQLLQATISVSLSQTQTLVSTELVYVDYVPQGDYH